jgi:hypothetical protein
MTQQTSPRIRAWTVVLAAVSINLILGVLYAWSVMGKALVLQWRSPAQRSVQAGMQKAIS